jgi:outer membrane protein OmpA-like peptidoglycan-associated protein
MGNRSRYKMTNTAKVLIFIFIIAIVCGGVFFANKQGLFKKATNKVTTVETNQDTTDTNGTATEVVADADGNVINYSTESNVINLSLDEWVGWDSIIIANGGLETQSGSIFDKLGIKVNISVINDATQSSNALIKGDLQGAGYTINRTAFLSRKFTDSGVNVVMPYITNYSNGGDGIIATNDFQTVESLVNAKIGVPQFSEAHSLIVWFVNQSDLTQKQKDTIIDNLIMFGTADEVAKAFFAGQIDVGATWQPYLTQAQNSTDSHVLFSTASSTKLIMDGILFRSDFAEANPDLISKFIKGCLQASELYGTEFESIKAVMPMFSVMTDEEIKEMTMQAELLTYNDNIDTLSNTASTVYTDMCNVWASVGEDVNTELVSTLFDSSYIETLADEFATITTTKESTVAVTDGNKDTIIDTEALLTKFATVNFMPDTAKFTDSAEASKTLDKFIKIAQSLDGTIIQIEGNIATDKQSKAGIKLSEERAKTVKNYFVMNGIDANRIIVVGNGNSKPLGDNSTESGKELNRRTDISFKTIEQ